ncbi:testis-expressed protein 9 isoform X2 [Patella vulgata]|uniref:testis-expressed protein 9 isoform X2 n=1 Tax=Patella vulgata TaxID=6465 RepID=UPI0021808329|nr:testis-expressed protein 9 isoform X2 [Patella vulgata]
MATRNENLRNARASSAKKSNNNAQSTTKSKSAGDILSREEEYKRLNEELEAKTASLVREAEQVMRGQEATLSRSRLLDNISPNDFLKDFDDELTGRNEDTKQKASGRPESKTSNSRPQSQNKKPPSARNRSKVSAKINKADDVAVPDETFLTDFKDFSLTNTISNIEGQPYHSDDEDDDILPQAAADMGSEATIRFLKAKLRVMQEELDRLSRECSKKEEENQQVVSRSKETEEEKNRLHRTVASQQTQIDKYKKIAEDAKSVSDSLQNQLSALRKENEQMKRTQKQHTANQSATEVRLNRALEEIERYKEQLLKAKSSSKDVTDQEKKKVEQLMNENRLLQKQKNELMTGFKKQLKLIDVLKRQKMHIEAAKMLQFSEEEFVKALEWGN